MPKDLWKYAILYFAPRKLRAGQAVIDALPFCQKAESLSMEKMETPWGIALTRQELAEGIFWVETAEHGGLLIEQIQAQALLSDPALKIGRIWDGFLAYEQEQDMVVVFYEHPELYPWVEEELTKKLAADNLQRFHPEYFQN